MTCLLFLSTLQMMYPGSGCLLSSYQTTFPIRSRGTLSFFRLWTCWYSLGSEFCAGIICAISPGSLLLVTLMGVVMIPSFYRLRRVFLCYNTTGSPNGKSVCEALERSSGMTLSHVDLVLSVRVRSVWRRKVTP